MLSSIFLVHTLNTVNTINTIVNTKCVYNTSCTSNSNNTNNNDKPKGKRESHSGCLWGHSGHLEEPAWGSHSGSRSLGWTLLAELFGLDLPGWTPLDLPGCTLMTGPFRLVLLGWTFLAGPPIHLPDRTLLTGPFWLDSPGWAKKITLKQLNQ